MPQLWFATNESFESSVIQGKALPDFANSGVSLARLYCSWRPGGQFDGRIHGSTPDAYGYTMMPPTGFGLLTLTPRRLEAGETRTLLKCEMDELMGGEP